jgi:hypothetical protein
MARAKHKTLSSIGIDETRDEDYVDLDKEIIYLPNGIRLTNAIAEKWAAEAESKPFGRPSLTAAGETSPEIKARVPKSMKADLETIAEQAGVNVSAVIRMALYEYIDKHIDLEKRVFKNLKNSNYSDCDGL